MSWLLALIAGIALGWLSFGGLWLTVRMVLLKPRYRAGIIVSQTGRLVLLALGLYVICWAGPASAMFGLGGVLIAKWHLIVKLGSVSNA